MYSAYKYEAINECLMSSAWVTVVDREIMQNITVSTIMRTF